MTGDNSSSFDSVAETFTCVLFEQAKVKTKLKAKKNENNFLNIFFIKISPCLCKF